MAANSRNIAGIWDIGATLGQVTGRRAHAEAILRRLTTPAGALVGCPTYGFDVTAEIGSVLPPSVIEQRVLEQCMAEEETVSARVTATFDVATATLRVDIVITDGDGPFKLALSASELTVAAFLEGTLLEQKAA